MAISTVESFLAVLDQSNVLGPEQLAEARQKAAAVDDAQQLAQALVRDGLLSDWQASQLSAGKTSLCLGKYVLIRPLGQGAMGKVFLGRHPTMDRQVALKILSKRVRKDPGSLQRFLSEARAVAALNHPNIVQAYDVDNHHDRYYIVLEYVQGQDLREIVQAEGPLSSARAADYIRQACQGLAHAHGRNMIHCDIKPSNLLLSAQGTVKIADLGVARLTAGSEDSSGEKEDKEAKVLGTVDYLAPEQALKGHDFDHRADIYSLGCTLYYLLTGRPPFAEGTLAQRILKHQTQQPPEILDLRPDVNKDLVEICRKMMAKDPDDRYASVEEVDRLLAVEWRRPKPKQSRAAAPGPSPAADEAERQAPPSINVDLTSGRVRPAASTPAAAADRQQPRGSSRRKLILVGSGVLLAVGISAAVIALVTAGRSDPKQSDAKPVAAVGSPPAKTPQDEQHDWPTPLYVDPQQTQPDDTATASPSKEQPGEKTDSTVDKSKQQPEKKSPEKKAPVAEKPEKATPAKQQPKTEGPAKKVEPKAEQRKTDTAAKEKPDTAAQAKTKPPAKEKPGPPGPKPPQAQTPEPKAKRAAKADPFRELAGAIDLPPLAGKSARQPPSAGPVALGKVHAGPKAAWKLALVGGNEAIKSDRRFLLERNDPQPGKPTWLVRLTGAGSGQQQTAAEVALIWLEGGSLMFRWLEGAAAVPAEHLRNCLLELNVDKKAHELRLATASKAEALVVDLERGAGRKTLPVKQLPAPDALRLEITSLEGPFPQHTFHPESTIRPGGQAEIRFDEEYLRGLKFRVAFTVKGRAARVELLSTSQTADQKRPRSLRKADVERINQMTMTARAMQHNLITQLHKLPAGDKRRATVQQQLDALNTRLTPLGKLADFCKAVHAVGKVHYRAFIVVGDRQLELLTTQPAVFELPADAPPTKTPTAKKSPAAKLPVTKTPAKKAPAKKLD